MTKFYKLRHPTNTPNIRHPGGSRDPDLQPVQMRKAWAPTFVGVTEFKKVRRDDEKRVRSPPKLKFRVDDGRVEAFVGDDSNVQRR